MVSLLHKLRAEEGSTAGTWADGTALESSAPEAAALEDIAAALEDIARSSCKRELRRTGGDTLKDTLRLLL